MILLINTVQNLANQHFTGSARTITSGGEEFVAIVHLEMVLKTLHILDCSQLLYKPSY